MDRELNEWEPSSFPTVATFDPGGTTGWCIMTVHPSSLSDDKYPILDNIVHREQGQLEGDEHEQVDAILELLDSWDSAAVLFEDFQLRTLAAELSPVRITATVSWACQRLFDPPKPVFLQMPVMAMSTATDDRLKRWGLYTPGAPHARDATRHAITFLRRVKESAELRRTAWPQFCT